MAVAAVNGDPATRAAEDLLRRAVVARHVDGLRLAAHDLDAVGLDQDVDDERATGLPLAVEAVAAMHEKRVARQPVANRSTGATALANHRQEPNRPQRTSHSRRTKEKS
jgi:hypothetical protein